MSNIFKKISEAKKKFGLIRKDGVNPHFKSKYATIDNVIAVIDPVLEEVGLTYYITQTKEMSSKLFVVDIESGEKVESESPLLLGKQDMQQLGSAYTYNRRYLLVTFFGLEQEDDDGNYASGRNIPPKQVVKNHTIQDVEKLAEVKNIPIENICKGYGVESLQALSQEQLNKAFLGLQKK